MHHVNGRAAGRRSDAACEHWSRACVFIAHLWLKYVSDLGLGIAAVHEDHLLLCVWVNEGADCLPQGAKYEGRTEHDHDGEPLWVMILEDVKDGVQSAEIQAVHSDVCTQPRSLMFDPLIFPQRAHSSEP